MRGPKDRRKQDRPRPRRPLFFAARANFVNDTLVEVSITLAAVATDPHQPTPPTDPPNRPPQPTPYLGSDQGNHYFGLLVTCTSILLDQTGGFSRLQKSGAWPNSRGTGLMYST